MDHIRWPALSYGAEPGSSTLGGTGLAFSDVGAPLIVPNSDTPKGGNNVAVGALVSWCQILPRGYCTHTAS